MSHHASSTFRDETHIHEMANDVIRVAASSSARKRPRTDTHDAAGLNPRPKLFSCRDCGKSYTRVDHLARHVKQHSQERPYICEVCEKGFARVDLLKRHRAGHADNERNTQAKQLIKRPSRSSRVAQACETCAVVHLKCENEKPCKRCKTKGLLCRYQTAPSDNIASAHDLTSEPRHIDEPLPSPPDDESTNEPLSFAARSQSKSLDRSFNARESSADGPNQCMLDDTTRVQQQVSDTLSLESDSACQTFDDTAEHHGSQLQQRQEPHALEFHGYLRGIMGRSDLSTQFSGGTWTPRNLFEYGAETELDLNDIDFSFLDDCDHIQPFDTGSDIGPDAAEPEPSPNTPLIETSSRPTLNMETTQTWRFRPVPKDTRDANLTLPTTMSHQLSLRSCHKITECLSHAMRDRVLAMIVSTGQQNRALLSFPSVELLDNLLQYYLSTNTAMLYLCHRPTFKPNDERPELCAAIIAAGAVMVPDASLNRLGWAIQEAVRIAIPNLIEGNNALIRNVKLLQAAIIALKIALWSGNSRKMELSESFMQPWTTMVRRAGWFGRKYDEIAPEASDEGQVLEEKWCRWIEQERRKRLVFFFFQHDSQASMTFFINPNISYAELSLPLPQESSLWNAGTAQAWKTACLARSVTTPSLLDLLHNLDVYCDRQDSFDHGMATQALLSAMWGLVREYRQQCSITSVTPNRWNNGQLVLSSRLTELKSLLSCISLGSSDSPSEGLLIEMLSMHLHMSLEEVHLFTGVDGDGEAKRVFPKLRDWVQTSSARQAMWHAGQVLRNAQTICAIHAHDAVSVYHAALAMWGFGVISNAVCSLNQSIGDTNVVLLTGAEDVQIQRYIRLDRGQPAVCGERAGRPVPLGEPGAVMNEVIHLMKRSHANQDSLPPLVLNLIGLMDGLRAAVSEAH